MTDCHAGYTTLRMEDAARERPIIVDAWYPAAAAETPHTYGLSRGSVAAEAAIHDGTYPLILLSHGALGAASNYAWIAEHLARSGYLVAGVSHYGESYVYGNDTIDPTSAAKPWLRPQDCSFVLDDLLGRPNFASRIDPSRIGALGHSSGGNTAIALGGAVFDAVAMQQYCLSEAGKLIRAVPMPAIKNHRLALKPPLNAAIAMTASTQLSPSTQLSVRGMTPLPWLMSVSPSIL